MEQDKKLSRAKNNAYCLLRSRPRSEAEIRKRLALKGYDTQTVDAVVESLRKAGEVDDERFARLWVESKMHSNPAGDIVLRRELQLKGISGPIIDAVLKKKAESYDEHAIALGMAEERFKQLAKVDKRKALKRLYDYLLRRGFNYDVVKDIVDKLIDENR